MAHPIPVRKMVFAAPTAEDFNPLYIAGNATLSYLHTALGLYVVYLEPFVVKAVFWSAMSERPVMAGNASSRTLPTADPGRPTSLVESRLPGAAT